MQNISHMSHTYILTERKSFTQSRPDRTYLLFLQQEMLELQQKIDHIQWRSDMMSNKIKDMAASTAMMTRVIRATGEDIAELE